jgi:YesN/AraC family two-component response regulator
MLHQKESQENTIITEDNMAKIVVIEDDELVCELLKEILTNAGHIVFTAADGVLGMNAVRQHHPDLIITDIVMPNKDGVTVIRELNKEFPATKIIAISGGGFNTPQYYLKIAEQVGSNCVIRKPVDEEDLLKAVDDLLLKK